jgi:hypothetical protein
MAAERRRQGQKNRRGDGSVEKGRKRWKRLRMLKEVLAYVFVMLWET